MKPKLCASCTAFQPTREPNKDGVVIGECRARPPILVSQWASNEGFGWQGGWVPTSSTQWCREHETKLEVLEGGKN